jgi:hypothetical protein
MLIQQIKNKIFDTKCSLLPLPEDKRDFKFGFWFGRSYEPKNARVELKPLRIFNQYFNTCGWTASTGAKEIAVPG